MTAAGRSRLGRFLASSRTATIAVLVACWGSFSCAAEAPAEGERSAPNRLVTGQLSPADRDAVVFIRANHPNGAFDDCSGTLVSPHVVITAKHCVTLVQPGQFVCSGAGVLLENGQGGGVFGAKINPEKIEIFVGTAPITAAVAHARAIFSTQSGDACHDDIAALVLDTPIQHPTYPSLRSVRPTRVGETVLLVGYGVKTQGALVQRRELPGVRVIDVGHDDASTRSGATAPPHTFSVEGGTVCFGDSGGPALATDTGALVGVYSRITGNCLSPESRNTYTLTASFTDLFDLAFKDAGERPSAELGTDSPVAGSTGAAAQVSTSPEPARHEATNCTLGLAPGKSVPAGVCLIVGLLALRRRARRP